MDTITDTTPGVTGGRRGFWGALWAGTRATLGALMGLAPHVMHHIGFLAGAALLTGFPTYNPPTYQCPREQISRR